MIASSRESSLRTLEIIIDNLEAARAQSFLGLDGLEVGAKGKSATVLDEAGFVALIPQGCTEESRKGPTNPLYK